MAEWSVHYTRETLDVAERAFIKHMKSGPKMMTQSQLREWMRAAIDAAIVSAIAEVHGQCVIDAEKYRRIRDKFLVPYQSRLPVGRNDL